MKIILTVTGTENDYLELKEEQSQKLNDWLLDEYGCGFDEDGSVMFLSGR